MESERSEPVAAETTGADNTGNSRASAATTNERARREAGTADKLSDLRPFRRGPLTITGRAGVPRASLPGRQHARLTRGDVRTDVLDGMGVVRAKGTVNNLEQLEGLVDAGRRRQLEALEAVSK